MSMKVKLRPNFYIVGHGPLHLNEYHNSGELNRQFRFSSVEETISFACSSGLSLRPTWQGDDDYFPDRESDSYPSGKEGDE